MADGNYQSKNFFTNILRTHLESKFNFATFETFIGPNCVKVCDKVHTEKEIDEKVNKRNDEYHNKTEEWKKRKSDHEKIVDEEVQQLIIDFNNKLNKQSDEQAQPEVAKAEDVVKPDSEAKIVPKPEQDSKDTKIVEAEITENNPAEQVETIEVIKMNEEQAKIAEATSEAAKIEANIDEKINEADLDQLVQNLKKEREFKEEKPENPQSSIRAAMFDLEIYKICEDDKVISVHYNSPIIRLPNVETHPKKLKMDLEIVLAPLQSLQVCQLFEKIIYLRNTCPKSSFSPSEPILFHGFSLYGPFPNQNTPSAFAMTFKVGNSRTNEVQIVRANVFDQKEKFYKFFLSQPMYVDQKDFVNIISVSNSPALAEFELGVSKKLYDSKQFHLQAYDEFKEQSDDSIIKSEAASGSGGVFLMSSDKMYFHGSDGVRFCNANHYYQCVGSIYYEKI